MRKLILTALLCALLCSCRAEALTDSREGDEPAAMFTVSRVTGQGKTEENANTEEMRGCWISQFDMQPLFRDGNSQREEKSYAQAVRTMADNLCRDGFNTVFLQVRPNGDSMYKSDIYPLSKYIAGTYGGDIGYDAVQIFIDIAKSRGISVHAWINPFRLCCMDELKSFGKGTLYEWMNEGIGKRIEMGEDGLLYLDPAYEEAGELIARGVCEIFEKYDFDGLHIDDYFYPTEFEFDDDAEFEQSGFADKGDFRRANINRVVRKLYETAHLYDKVFGISPAGNIYSLENGWYADIYNWCENDGFADYIMPQLYFGFENAYCPFEEILKAWKSAVKNKNMKLYIGLSAAKCALGSEGFEDVYAGEDGKFEWKDRKDILSRSLKLIRKENADGFCIFAYSSFYNHLNGEDNPLTQEEKAAFLEILKNGE